MVASAADAVVPAVVVAAEVAASSSSSSSSDGNSGPVAASPASAPAAATAAAHEAKRFLLKHKEKLQMNQYWSVGGARSQSKEDPHCSLRDDNVS